MKFVRWSVLFAVWWSVGLNVMATEEAKYTVITKEGACELRDYAPYVLAETVVGGNLEEAGNTAFGRLFDYISGRNRPHVKIRMTAPVSQEAQAQKIAMTAPVAQQRTLQGWAVSFTLPAAFTLASAPIPTDARITLREVPERRVADRKSVV